VAGILLTWLRAFSEFGATIILAYHPFSLPVFTYVQFDERGLPGTVLPVVAALALALLVLVLAQLPLPRRRVGAHAARRVKPTPPRLPSGSSSAPTLEFALAKRLGAFSLELSHASASPRLALLGPSGAGKTLTLRLISGLTRPFRGSHVRAGDRTLDGLPTERRGIGYVPQQSALLPRRTVWGQVTFGVGAQPRLAAWWLDRLGLEGLEDRYPEELSGGQQRRVSLARALAVAPRLLLLDEPFTGLDAPVRDRLRRDLRRLQREIGLSTVIVTHDPEEAAMLAEEILVIDRGRLLQVGTRRKVFREPASPAVAELLGIANTRRGRLTGQRRIEVEGAPGILLPAPQRPELDRLGEGSPVIWSVRPERIVLDPRGPYEGTLIDDVDLGSVSELTVSLAPGLELTVRTSDEPAAIVAGPASSISDPAAGASDDTPGLLGSEPPSVGEPVRLSIDPADISVWPDPGR
jgi:ABC-type Fe3+/spermidine/putrescine transport system ATPase subunit